MRYKRCDIPSGPQHFSHHSHHDSHHIFHMFALRPPEYRLRPNILYRPRGVSPAPNWPTNLGLLHSEHRYYLGGATIPDLSIQLEVCLLKCLGPSSYRRGGATVRLHPHRFAPSGIPFRRFLRATPDNHRFRLVHKFRLVDIII